MYIHLHLLSHKASAGTHAGDSTKRTTASEAWASDASQYSRIMKPAPGLDVEAIKRVMSVTRVSWEKFAGRGMLDGINMCGSRAEQRPG